MYTHYRLRFTIAALTGCAMGWHLWEGGQGWGVNVNFFFKSSYLIYIYYNVSNSINDYLRWFRIEWGSWTVIEIGNLDFLFVGIFSFFLLIYLHICQISLGTSFPSLITLSFCRESSGLILLGENKGVARDVIDALLIARRRNQLVRKYW